MKKSSVHIDPADLDFSKTLHKMGNAAFFPSTLDIPIELDSEIGDDYVLLVFHYPSEGEKTTELFKEGVWIKTGVHSGRLYELLIKKFSGPKNSKEISTSLKKAILALQESAESSRPKHVSRPSTKWNYESARRLIDEHRELFIQGNGSS